MKTRSLLRRVIGLCFGLGLTAGAADYYVSLSGGHVPPFTNWTDAATNIQDAIDAASAGDTVWVTNGVYATGGKVMAGDLTNRVALDKALTVRSVNGPDVTLIQGVGPVGTNAVRCAWLTNGADLTGFTLSGGATRSSGDQFYLRSGGGAWCAGMNAVLSNCISRSNSASSLGGGGYRGEWKHCVLEQNTALNGGGAAYGIFKNSYIRQNVSSGSGGGVFSALSAGATLVNCLVTENYATVTAGGIYGGSTSAILLTNCTVSLNTAANGGGGGAIMGTFVNCIVYQNQAPSAPNYSASVFQYSCSVPLPGGVGNIGVDPHLLGSSLHLANSSLCRGAGTNLVNGTDLDGQSWSNPPSMGCFEWQPTLVLGDPMPRVASEIGKLFLEVLVAGESPACMWTKDGSPVEDDEHYDSAHAPRLVVNGFGPLDAGSYQVVVSNAYGVVTSDVATVVVRCVDATATNPVSPYLDWGTAAANIQDAIDVAGGGDFVLVTNGVYATGGKVMAGDLTNRVALDKALTVQSVNGPFSTFIQGDGATNGLSGVRGVWVTNGASLNGFTIRWGATRTSGDSVTLRYGGGIWCASSNAFVSQCVIQSNTAAVWGGGVYQGNLRNCNISWNIAQTGGGTASSVLNNCTVVTNTGGGVYFGPMTNSISYFNTPNNYAGPLPPFPYFCSVSGVSTPSANSNITANPLLLEDDIHLSAASPCRGAGTNLVSGPDLDGQAWLNPPSIGCDEWSASPVIYAQPKSQVSGYPVGLYLGLGVAGMDPLTCYWTRDGTPIAEDEFYSQTQTTNLFISGASLAIAGSYQVVVSNAYGMATSAVVRVSVRCVDASGTSPVPPYLNWSGAATNIQDAINVALPGDIVLVTNGVYANGGKAIGNDLTNRVAVDKSLLVQSVNGPTLTVIDGASSANGPVAVRCAWLTNGAVLNGFTLQRGATRITGSTANQVNSGGGVYGTSNSAMVINCAVFTNFAYFSGGGAYRVSLRDCKLIGNQAVGNGDPSTGSGHGGSGGGAAESSLVNCFLDGNIAVQGEAGGTLNCSLKNCFLTRNSTHWSGGAAFAGTLVNCTVTGNISAGYAIDVGGAVAAAALTNCIVYGNLHRVPTPLTPTNYNSCTFAYSASDPLPAGNGNISVDPKLLADGLHLAMDSPCRGAGTNTVVSGVDIDGQAWNAPPSMGCDEWHPEPVFAVGPQLLLHPLQDKLTASVTVAGAAPFTYSWNKDGVGVSDGTKYSGSGSASLVVSNFNLPDAGGYQVVVSNSFGVATSAVAHLVIRCVDVATASPVTPYTNWSTAAPTIQDAIDAASAGDVVLVTNGVYASGGRVVVGTLTNRVVLDKALSVVSVNGPGVTTIKGQWDPVTTNGPLAVRCVWMARDSVLSGFTIQGGATSSVEDSSAQRSGGGVACESITSRIVNSVILGNAAYEYGGGVAGGTVINSKILGNRSVGPSNIASGGGATGSQLINCFVSGNFASSAGGGTHYGSLANCAVVSNSCNSAFGGGTYFSRATNSIVYLNRVGSPVWSGNDNYYAPPFFGEYAYVNCCTYPPRSYPGDLANIFDDPQFLDSYHIAVGSACRGAGTNLAAGVDLDGEPWATPPSIGCDEVWESSLTGALAVTISTPYPFVAAGGVLPLAGLIEGRASRVEWRFGDGSMLTNLSFVNTYHAWTNAGNYSVLFTAFNTDHPGGVSTNLEVEVVPLAAPLIADPALDAASFTLSFQGQPGVNYWVDRATNLAAPVGWQAWRILYSTGQVMQVTDTAATNDMRFYRVRVP